MREVVYGYDGKSQPIIAQETDCGCKWSQDGKSRLSSCPACFYESVKLHTRQSQLTDMEAKFIIGWIGSRNPKIMNEALDAMESGYRSRR
jgi:hypothetical protein